MLWWWIIIVMCCYSDTWQCVVFYLSQWIVNELLCDAILGTNLHLSEEYKWICIRLLSVDVNLITIIVPPSSLIWSCTVTTTWVENFIPFSGWYANQSVATYSSKPSNSQRILFTDTSYTELHLIWLLY